MKVWTVVPTPVLDVLAHIVSKILAGGLTAGVFLLWWPRHFPDTGIEGLVIRGLAGR